MNRFLERGLETVFSLFLEYPQKLKLFTHYVPSDALCGIKKIKLSV